MNAGAPLTRRGFFRRILGLAANAAALPFLRRAVPGALLASAAGAGCREKAPTGFLLPRERETLAAAVEWVIPADSQPGAREAGVVDYIDTLLGAFLFHPPRIFAGGPYSGRHGGPASFQNFLPLTRVQEIRWRTYIEGSNGIPEREFNGPVTGIQRVYREGLAALEAAARRTFGAPFSSVPLAQRGALIEAAGSGFQNALSVHVMEGMYGDPVYGGNRNLVGWTNIHYEGDRQPIGYTLAQMSEPDP